MWDIINSVNLRTIKIEYFPVIFSLCQKVLFAFLVNKDEKLKAVRISQLRAC